MSERTVALNIGRGAHGSEREMSETDWWAFRSSLKFIVEYWHGTIYTEANGIGTWEGETEDSYVIVAGMPTDALGHVRQSLAGLARIYNQDAIAMTVGTVDLVTPSEEDE